MTVSELIEILKNVPQDNEVSIFWDGAARGEVEGIVCNEEDGLVIIGEWPCYGIDYSMDEIIFSKGDLKIADNSNNNDCELKLPEFWEKQLIHVAKHGHI